MNREELEQRIVERLYGEISELEDERLTAWLAAHPEDALVMEELQKAFQFLNQHECRVAAAPPPIQLPLAVKPQAAPRSFFWSKVAVAAVFLLFAAGFWRGVEIQVGAVRLALGPVPTAPVVPDQSAYIQDLLQTVSTLNSTHEKFLARQEAMEQEMGLMKTYLVSGQQLTDEKFKRFTDELARYIDNRMKASTAYVSLPANMTRGMPVTPGGEEGKM